MEDVSRTAAQCEEDRRRIKSTPAFAPAGQSTQLIVGASTEDDRTIITLSGALYRKFSLRRVYYSAFTPVGVPGGGGIPDPRLPAYAGEGFDGGASLPFADQPSRRLLVREHRLYQADWLIRFYHFAPEEILDESPYLDTCLDPKTAWALKHLDRFPVELNRADHEELLRVPGIGAVSARRIIEGRRGTENFAGASRSLSFDRLRRLGVVLNRARYFITLNGAFLDRPDNPRRIRRLIADENGSGLQLPLFEF
jgi:predicted DNA-binding helix-hairpin-helix protein